MDIGDIAKLLIEEGLKLQAETSIGKPIKYKFHKLKDTDCFLH